MQNRPSRVRKNYRAIISELKKRYGAKDPPATVRKQMYCAKQLVEESLEEFSDRVLQLAQEGYPHAGRAMLQDIAVDVFIRGLSDRRLAELVIEQDPKTVEKALQYAKRSMYNMRSLGSKSILSGRQVSFDSSDKTAGEEIRARSVGTSEAYS